MSSSDGVRKKQQVIGEGLWRQSSSDGVRKKQPVIGEGVWRPNLMLMPKAVARPKVFLRPKAVARPKVRGTAGQMPGKCPGPDVGPLKKNAYLELRRRRDEIGWEKRQLDLEEANVDKAIALLEEEFRLTVKEGEENTEEDLVEEEDVIEVGAEEDEETISFTAAAAEEEARALYVEAAAAEAAAAFDAGIIMASAEP
jgi:hypothetical protein